MKPTVPETGRVIKIDGDMAVVLLHGGQSCKGCGAAAIGLCRSSGSSATLTIRNTRHAVPGDTVTVALDKSIERRGLLLAYGIPLLSFLGGSMLGHILAAQFPIPSLEVITGFLSLVASSLYCFGRLRKLDRSSMMFIKNIVSKNRYPGN